MNSEPSPSTPFSRIYIRRRHHCRTRKRHLFQLVHVHPMQYTHIHRMRLLVSPVDLTGTLTQRSYLVSRELISEVCHVDTASAAERFARQSFGECVAANGILGP